MSHPRYRGPVLDAHCHFDGPHHDEATAALRDAGISACLNLWNLAWPPPGFGAWRASLPKQAPLAVALGHTPDLEGVGGADFDERLRAGLEEADRDGAAAVKVWKNLGLELRDVDDRLVRVDDPRLDVLWRTCGEAELPIVIHVADPVAFFRPIDERNERRRELEEHPDWWFGGPQHPSFEALMEQLEAVVTAHPATIFVGAHMGCYAENLDWVSGMLDRHPNFFVDTSARIAEVGRRDPDEVRDFFVRHADRIVFGSDLLRTQRLQMPEAGVGADDLGEFFDRHWRFFETREADLPHPFPLQGAWRVHGVDLPDDVLERVYFRNAARLFPRLREASHVG